MILLFLVRVFRRNLIAVVGNPLGVHPFVQRAARCLTGSPRTPVAPTSSAPPQTDPGDSSSSLSPRTAAIVRGRAQVFQGAFLNLQSHSDPDRPLHARKGRPGAPASQIWPHQIGQIDDRDDRNAELIRRPPGPPTNGCSGRVPGGRAPARRRPAARRRRMMSMDSRIAVPAVITSSTIRTAPRAGCRRCCRLRRDPWLPCG
jgi:hypothetical protein